MAAKDTVSWDLFKWVVAPLCGTVVVAVASVLAVLHSDIGGLRSDIVDVRKSLEANHVEAVREAGLIRAEVATANGKLDRIIANQGRPRQ